VDIGAVERMRGDLRTPAGSGDEGIVKSTKYRLKHYIRVIQDFMVPET